MKCMQIKKNISIQDESTIINEEITTYNFDMKETFINLYDSGNKYTIQK